MRNCDRILVVFDYWGVSMRQLKDAFKYVANHEIPKRCFPHYEEMFWASPDGNHIQAQYEGRPCIIARDDFEKANKIVYRFLKTSGIIEHDICSDYTNQFD